MSDYIDRNEVINIIYNLRCDYGMCPRNVVLEAISHITPADVRRNAHAHWEDRDGISDFMYCSNCGGKKHYSEKWKGCPYCLAIMDAEPKPKPKLGAVGKPSSLKKIHIKKKRMI